jgi:O-antigen ligase
MRLDTLTPQSTGQHSRIQAFALLAIAVLPIAFQQMRFIPGEPYRAGMLAVLVVFALPALRWRGFAKEGRWLIWAALAWCAALCLSTVFSLSPAQSAVGDLYRDMGLWTQLCLTAALFIGAQISLRRAESYFWLAGIAVALFSILQWYGLVHDPDPDVARAAGMLGNATATAGWLVIAILWASMGFGGLKTPFRKRVFVGGIALMVFALITTGSRGATLALIAGAITATLIYSTIHRLRRPILALGGILIAGGIGILFLSQFTGLPLFPRFRINANDETVQFRIAVWTTAGAVAQTWHTLSNTNNEPDRWSMLRPLVGYGLEMFQFPYQYAVNNDPHLIREPGRIDRAHNDWFDTLVMMGWGGVLARVFLWVAVWWTALRRLKLAQRGAWLALLVSMGLSAAVAWNAAWFPVAVTLGALIGCWGWLLFCLFFGRQAANDPCALLALAVLSAYLVDLQFIFVTVANSLPAWITFGLLLSVPRQEIPLSERQDNDDWSAWLALAGAILIRETIASRDSVFATIFLLLGIAAAALFFLNPSRRALPVIGSIWLFGFIGAYLTDPGLSAIWDVVFIILAFILLARSAGSAVKPLRAILLVAALVLWWSETASDIQLRKAFALPTVPEQTIGIRASAWLRPLDYRIIATAGDKALVASIDASGSSRLDWLLTGTLFLEQASQLNGFDMAMVAPYSNSASEP